MVNYLMEKINLYLIIYNNIYLGWIKLLNVKSVLRRPKSNTCEFMMEGLEYFCK